MTDDDPTTPSQTATPDQPGAAGAAAPAASVTFSRRFLLLVGALVVVLAFVAAFAGARTGAPAPAAAPAPTVTVEPTAAPEPEPEADEDGGDAIDEAELVETVLPAGSDVRAGRGAPAAAYGEYGDVYIDLDSTGIYLRQDTGWTRVGDIRTAAAENLTGAQGEKGATGETGATGAQGETGADGAAGADGTRVALATEAPSGACTGDDIVVDTVTVAFFQCVDGTWTAFGP